MDAVCGASKCVLLVLITLCTPGGCVSTPQPLPEEPNGSLVPVPTTLKEVIRQELLEFFYFLRVGGYLMSQPMTGYPEGFWEPRELDSDTMERIPTKKLDTLDPKGELPDDIIEDLRKKGEEISH